MNRTLSIFILALSFIVFAGLSTAVADSNANAYGHAWSSNIGWLSFNNCKDDPATDTNCRSQDYGVSFLMMPSSNGGASGYAWSSNVGWVSFNDQGCPTAEVPGCTGGARIDWANANADGSHNIKGWARACSVYESGCSGAITIAGKNGGWDGYIALGGKADNGDPFGVTIAGTGLSGYAWGGEVLGWISFNGVKISNGANIAQLSFYADQTSVPFGGSTMLHADAKGIDAGSCRIDPRIGAVQMVAAADGYTMSPVSTGSLTAALTTFTMTCKNAKTGDIITRSVDIATTGGDACDPADPTCNGGGGGGDGGGGGGDGGTPVPPACSDGKDNDGDGLIDFTGGIDKNGNAVGADPGCKSADDTDERDVKIKEF